MLYVGFVVTRLKYTILLQVLAKGLVITSSNIDKLLAEMAIKLKKFESTLADNFKTCLENTNCNFASVSNKRNLFYWL
jgi:hypothetical protein